MEGQHQIYLALNAKKILYTFTKNFRGALC